MQGCGWDFTLIIFISGSAQWTIVGHQPIPLVEEHFNISVNFDTRFMLKYDFYGKYSSQYPKLSLKINDDEPFLEVALRDEGRVQLFGKVVQVDKKAYLDTWTTVVFFVVPAGGNRLDSKVIIKGVKKVETISDFQLPSANSTTLLSAEANNNGKIRNVLVYGPRRIHFDDEKYPIGEIGEARITTEFYVNDETESYSIASVSKNDPLRGDLITALTTTPSLTFPGSAPVKFTETELLHFTGLPWKIKQGGFRKGENVQLSYMLPFRVLPSIQTFKEAGIIGYIHDSSSYNLFDFSSYKRDEATVKNCRMKQIKMEFKISKTKATYVAVEPMADYPCNDYMTDLSFKIYHDTKTMTQTYIEEDAEASVRVHSFTFHPTYTSVIVGKFTQFTRIKFKVHYDVEPTTNVNKVVSVSVDAWYNEYMDGVQKKKLTQNTLTSQLEENTGFILKNRNHRCCLSMQSTKSIVCVMDEKKCLVVKQTSNRFSTRDGCFKVAETDSVVRLAPCDRTDKSQIVTWKNNDLIFSKTSKKLFALVKGPQVGIKDHDYTLRVTTKKKEGSKFTAMALKPLHSEEFSPCYLKDTLIRGNPFTTIADVQTWQTCSLHCRARTHCTAWSWGSEGEDKEGICQLLGRPTSQDAPMERSGLETIGWMSGYRWCSVSVDKLTANEATTINKAEGFRPDGRCGPEYQWNGKPGRCDPQGWANEKGPCCSFKGYCGNSEKHCECGNECVDYRLKKMDRIYESAVASSTITGDKHDYGPENAWFSPPGQDPDYFLSDKEHSPWLSIQLLPTLITSVTIHTRHNCCGDRMKPLLEIRAGTSNVATDKKSYICHNWTTEEKKLLAEGLTEGQVCLRGGNKWTTGNLPGCGVCMCCKPVVIYDNNIVAQWRGPSETGQKHILQMQHTIWATQITFTLNSKTTGMEELAINDITLNEVDAKSTDPFISADASPTHNKPNDASYSATKAWIGRSVKPLTNWYMSAPQNSPWIIFKIKPTFLTGVIISTSISNKGFRPDGRCGEKFYWNGKPGRCDPTDENSAPCCSSGMFCGVFCTCDGCIDYRTTSLEGDNVVVSAGHERLGYEVIGSLHTPFDPHKDNSFLFHELIKVSQVKIVNKKENCQLGLNGVTLMREEELQCPISHPHAFSNGSACCQAQRYIKDEQGSSMAECRVVFSKDGCCPGGERVPCPHSTCISRYANEVSDMSVLVLNDHLYFCSNVPEDERSGCYKHSVSETLVESIPSTMSHILGGNKYTGTLFGRGPQGQLLKYKKKDGTHSIISNELFEKERVSGRGFVRAKAYEKKQLASRNEDIQFTIKGERFTMTYYGVLSERTKVHLIQGLPGKGCEYVVGSSQLLALTSCWDIKDFCPSVLDGYYWVKKDFGTRRIKCQFSNRYGQ